jgi:AcrR family transcriptional regulator
MSEMSVESARAASSSGATPPNRRTRGRERRRNQVYEAAVALIIDKGFDNTTMDDIAERADVARGTVFNHFARKTAILDEWSARRRRRAIEAVYSEHLEDHSVREILERYMIELAEISVRTRAETVALMGAAVHTTNVLGNPALADELGSILERARDDGHLASGADPRLGGLLLATGYFATLSAWIVEEPAPFALRDRLVNVVDIVLDGLMPRSDGDR